MTLSVTCYYIPGLPTGGIIGGSDCLTDGSNSTYLTFFASGSGGSGEDVAVVLAGTWSRPSGSTAPVGIVQIDCVMSGANPDGDSIGVAEESYGYDPATGHFAGFVGRPFSGAGFVWPSTGSPFTAPMVDADAGPMALSPAQAATIDAAGGNVALTFNYYAASGHPPTINLYEMTATITWGGTAITATPPLFQRSRNVVTDGFHARGCL